MIAVCRAALLLSALIASQLPAAEKAGYDVRDFGAVADGKTLCTEAIQKAIDAASSAGGGTVLLSGGPFLTGSIEMKSKVTLHIDRGAVLLGSTKIEHYPPFQAQRRSYTDNYTVRALIFGQNLEQIAITGPGTIDGQGSAFKNPNKEEIYKFRPFGLRLINCRDVLVENLRLQNSGCWMQQYLLCRRVTLRNLNVINHCNFNNDGLDIDSCTDVTVSDCHIDSDDDGLCLKSTTDVPCENIAISNCAISSHCNAIKMGTESSGGFINISISNCVISSPRDTKKIYGRDRGISGLSLEIVDGGKMQNIAVSNLSIQGVTVPIFVRLGNRARPWHKEAPTPGVGTLSNVVISNVIASAASPTGCSITGLPDHPVQDISLNNVQIVYEGGGDKKLVSKKVDERADKYPEAMMFGDLPAYGFYCRHASGLRLNNVTLRTEKPDLRHAIVCDDVRELGIENLRVPAAEGAASILRLRDVDGAVIRGFQSAGGKVPFVRLEGKATARIAMTGNDPGPAEIECDKDVAAEALVK